MTSRGVKSADRRAGTGIVIRPVAFARAVVPAVIVAAQRRPRRWIDQHAIALLIMGFGLCWILALAGAAFAVRALLLLCFAAWADLRCPRLRAAIGRSRG